MNGFQKRAIKSWEAKAESWVKGHIALTLIALVLGILTLRGIVGAVKVGEPFSVKQIVMSAISSTVNTDDYGHTNILLLGVGGEGHDGENLTDTIIVASIDHKKNLVPMLSIPRDLYVENDLIGWGTRINGIYEYIYDDTGDANLAMSELVSEVENILDIEIQYYAKIDFKGFKEIVDAVGGVEVTVDEEIYDATYPAPPGYDNDYDPFYLAAGTQLLDGETALKYARSRHSTSDFDRARRQQEIINALKDKAMSIGFLFNPGRIKDTLTAVSNNFETNLSISEIINLAGMADEFSSESIITEVLNDEAYKTGGFLYTPEREEYGGAFVLLPFSGDFEEIRTFAQLFFYHPEIYITNTPIQILNGTKEESLAGLTKMYLARYGFNIVAYGNAANTNANDTSIIPLNKESEDTAELLPSLTFGEIIDDIPNEYLPENWPTDAEIILELGDDFVDFYKEHDERFYIGFY